MCVNKLHILNKGYNPLDTLSTKYIDVPCGHCWQCRQSRSNGYAFRVLHECLKPSSVPFFVTLTYSDKYLPTLVYQPFKHTYFKRLSMWNRNHIQRFNKVLRRQIQYYFNIPSNGFKYLITCERGKSERYLSDSGRWRIGTSRPHYHCIYILNTQNAELVRELPDSFISWCSSHSVSPDFVSFFKYLLHDRWFYGHVDDISFCRNIVGAVRYVCKYILKDDNEPSSTIDFDKDKIIRLEDNSFVQDSVNWKNSGKVIKFVYNPQVDNYIPEYRYSKRPPVPVKFTELLPRTISSINLGFDYISTLDMSQVSDLLTGRTKVVLPSVYSASQITLPSYFYRKMCKRSGTLHYNRYYTRPDNSPNTFKYAHIFTLPRIYARRTWDNVNGYIWSGITSSYSVSGYSQFGRLVRRLQFVQRYKKFRNNVLSVLSNLSFWVSSFRDSVLPDYLEDCRNSFSLTSLQHYTETHFSMADYLYYLRNSVSSPFVQLFNFVEKCSLLTSHLNHLKHELLFQRNLNPTVNDNPALFTNHFI